MHFTPLRERCYRGFSYRVFHLTFLDRDYSLLPFIVLEVKYTNVMLLSLIKSHRSSRAKARRVCSVPGEVCQCGSVRSMGSPRSDGPARSCVAMRYTAVLYP